MCTDRLRGETWLNNQWESKSARMTIHFDEATAITQVNPHTYSANFSDAWSIGTVPNGGYITACFLRVARLHFATTLAKQDQPDTITVHLEFMRRTQVGPATFTVAEKKLGRQASVVHITLTQEGREEVVAYLSNTNLKTEKGISFPTEWALNPPALPADIPKFAGNLDDNWEEQKHMPFAKFRKSSSRMRWFFPRQGQRFKSISDEWIGWSTGQKMTQDALGFACDNFPLVVESYVKDRPYDVKHGEEAEHNAAEMKPARFWYPTLLLNLDIVKRLPDEGVDFLFVRAQSKRIRNGRLDIEVTILDEQGDLVAVSHHVVLVVDASRNLAKRSGSNGKL